MIGRNERTAEVNTALETIEAAGCRLGRNDRRIIGELLADLAHRDRLSPAGLLDSPDLVAVLGDTRRNGPQKTTALKERLQARQWPTYGMAEAAFQAARRDLRLHPKIRVEHTPYFEDGRLNISFTADDQAELSDIIDSLASLNGKDLVKDALETSEDPD